MVLLLMELCSEFLDNSQALIGQIILKYEIRFSNLRTITTTVFTVWVFSQGFTKMFLGNGLSITGIAGSINIIKQFFFFFFLNIAVTTHWQIIKYYSFIQLMGDPHVLYIYITVLYNFRTFLVLQIFLWHISLINVFMQFLYHAFHVMHIIFDFSYFIT